MFQNLNSISSELKRNYRWFYDFARRITEELQLLSEYSVVFENYNFGKEFSNLTALGFAKVANTSTLLLYETVTTCQLPSFTPVGNEAETFVTSDPRENENWTDSPPSMISSAIKSCNSLYRPLYSNSPESSSVANLKYTKKKLILKGNFLNIARKG